MLLSPSSVSLLVYRLGVVAEFDYLCNPIKYSMLENFTLEGSPLPGMSASRGQSQSPRQHKKLLQWELITRTVISLHYSGISKKESHIYTLFDVHHACLAGAELSPIILVADLTVARPRKAFVKHSSAILHGLELNFTWPEQAFVCNFTWPGAQHTCNST